MAIESQKKSSEQFKELGRQIGRLILSLELSEKQKLAWAARIPKMNLKQMAKAIDILTTHANIELLKVVNKVRQQYQRLNK